MKIRIQKLDENAIIPSYSKDGDAGMDISSIGIVNSERYIEHLTGLSIEIPKGFVGLIFPRSSITNTGLMIKNAVGVIDSGYRGEIRVRFQDLEVPYDAEYKVGDRIAQLIILPYPPIEFEQVEELSESERGTGGYGSSGK